MNTIQIITSTASRLWRRGSQKLSRICGRTPVIKTEVKPPVDEFVHETSVEVTGKATQKAEAKVTKPTDMDIMNFHQYMLAKKLDLKCTPEEIKKLLSFEGQKFHLKSFEFFLKKMNIPKKLQPKLVYSAENPEIGMIYNWHNNTIHINTNFTFKSKEDFLTLMRHEFQHYQQNMQLFRHEQYGKDIVEYYSDLSARIETQNIDDRAKNLTIKQIKELGFNEEGIQAYVYLKNLLKNNKIEEYEKSLDATCAKFKELYKPQYENFRQRVIEEFGILKSDTKEGDRVSRYFKEAISEDLYYEENGRINTIKYITDIREAEAILAQDIMKLNIQGFNQKKFCYLKYLKDCLKKFEEPQGEVKEEITRLKEDAKKLEQEISLTEEIQPDVRQIARYYFD